MTYRLTYAFLCEYMSSCGIFLERVKDKKYKYKLKELYFRNLPELRKHIKTYY